MIEFNEEYKKAAKEFRKVFGYAVPLSMIPPTTDTNTLIKHIEECIELNNDDLLERFNVSYDADSLI